VTIAVFTELANDPATGVHLQRGMLAAPAGAPPAPAGFADPTTFEPVAADDLPAGFEFGLWTTVPTVNMPRYLGYLTDRFTAAGGRIETAVIRSLADVAGEAPLLANCTGVGARDLVPDEAVHAVRGQHVIVANPGLDTFFLEAPFGPAWTSYLPHGDVVVLGGTATVDDTNLAADPAMARAIVERCAAVEPRLRDAPVLEHRVGLRPAREPIRVEVEQIGPARCVHDYGHGGVGVTLSWGCAREAAALLAR
jgi:D-amino-acid oxidase